MCDIINNSILEEKDIIETLQSVYDPDIHYSIYDIGLIYGVNISNNHIEVIMTLTSVNCPEAQNLPNNVETALKNKFQDYSVHVELTFDPEWSVENMSEEVKLGLGLL